MSRPKDADPAATWNRIVDAAHESLRENSTNRISLRVVASKADVSMGTLHYYFRTKEVLLEAALDRYYERLRALGAELLEKSRLQQDKRGFIAYSTRSLWRLHWAERKSMQVRALARARHGALPETRSARFQVPQVSAARAGLMAMTGISAARAAFAVQSMIHLIFRYTVCSDEERALIVGEGGDLSAIEDHLVEVALALTFREKA